MQGSEPRGTQMRLYCVTKSLRSIYLPYLLPTYVNIHITHTADAINYITIYEVVRYIVLRYKHSLQNFKEVMYNDNILNSKLRINSLSCISFYCISVFSLYGKTPIAVLL